MPAPFSRRLARHLLTLCAALSLLSCVAVCVLWARSYGRSEQVSWRNAGGWRSVRSACGDVEVALLRADWSAYPHEFRGLGYERDVARPPFNYLLLLGGSWDDKDFDWQWHGFAWHQKRNTRQGILHAQGVVPFWSVATAAAALPLAWATLRLRARVRRRRRESSGLCPACGYDLRATPERCPECGVVVGGGGGGGGGFRPRPPAPPLTPPPPAPP